MWSESKLGIVVFAPRVELAQGFAPSSSPRREHLSTASPTTASPAQSNLPPYNGSANPLQLSRTFASRSPLINKLAPALLSLVSSPTARGDTHLGSRAQLAKFRSQLPVLLCCTTRGA